ncbi:MAG: hypothetical protein RL033_187 [Pseudomonadota bacterium]|jgi:hypothetical protein
MGMTAVAPVGMAAVGPVSTRGAVSTRRMLSLGAVVRVAVVCVRHSELVRPCLETLPSVAAILYDPSTFEPGAAQVVACYRPTRAGE